MPTCHIVTFNLRCAWDTIDGTNCFIHRAGLIAEVINERRPDILAFQEAVPQSVAFLKRSLPGYTFVYSGRHPGYTGEGLLLALRDERVQLMTVDRFWLSPTPRIPGSRYENQSQNPRVCQWAHLLVEGEPLWLCNNHLDDLSDEARVQGLRQVLHHINATRIPKAPLVVCGDFNARPDSGVIALATGAGLTDLAADCGGTFHDFGRRAAPSKIDYVFVDESLTRHPHTAELWEDTRNGIYLSDHYPVSVGISW